MSLSNCAALGLCIAQGMQWKIHYYMYIFPHLFTGTQELDHYGVQIL